MQCLIKKNITDNINLKKELLADLLFIDQITSLTKIIINTFEKGKKLYIAGNGGSAADASHMAAELVGRFNKERKALPAICLNTDTAILTAVSNDYSYDQVFLRQVQALVQEEDVFLAISTSGNSVNLIKVLEYLKDKNITTISLTGKDGGIIKKLSNITILVPSYNTARIQEVHSLVIHTICELVENHFFN